MNEIKTRQDANILLDAVIKAIDAVKVAGYENCLVIIGSINDLRRLQDWLNAEEGAKGTDAV